MINVDFSRLERQVLCSPIHSRADPLILMFKGNNKLAHINTGTVQQVLQATPVHMLKAAVWFQNRI